MKWVILILESLHGVRNLANKKELKDLNVFVILITSLAQSEKTQIAYLTKLMKQTTNQFELVLIELPTSFKDQNQTELSLQNVL